MRESGLSLVITNLVIAALALRAFAATAYEWHGNPIALAPIPNLSTDGCHDAGKLVPGNMWKDYIFIVAHPTVPVAPTYARRFDLNDSARAIRQGVIDSTDLYRPLKLLINRSPHTSTL